MATMADKNVNVGNPSAGADHLDRLLAVARASVIQAIACHVRVHFYEGELDDCPEAEIDRIVDRFRPSFPWLDRARIAIRQAAAAVDPKKAAGEKRPRKAHGGRDGDKAENRRGQKKKRRGQNPDGSTAKAKEADEIDVAEENADRDDSSKSEEARKGKKSSRAAGARRGQKRKRPGPDPGDATAKAKEADEIEGAEENADRDEVSKPEEARDHSKDGDDLDDTSSGGPTRKKPRAPRIPWPERIAACREYYAKHGHLNITPKDPDLGHYNDWFMRMRESAIILEKRGKTTNGLNPSRLAELREVGFRSKAERRNDRFQLMFEELKRYKSNHGHCKIPSSDVSELGKWYRYTKAEYSRLLRGEKSRLTGMDIAKLTEIGFALPRTTRGPNRKWEEWMELCRSFLAENGHLKIPIAHPTLGDFCGRARMAYKDRQEGRQNSLLTDERERELEDMGFVWLAGSRLKVQLGPDGRKLTRTFDEWFEILLEFREAHGHVLVPQGHPGGLGVWVAHMRTGARCLRTGRGALRGMTHERYMRLADIGFQFDVTNLRGRRKSSGEVVPEAKIA